ncbi:MAG: CopD family protein [Pseudomonadota bacterium]|nr:MAG: CopD family protein [Pseudomonadota bacterium]
MYNSLAIVLHMLASAVWVGGMFFAYMALRPAAAELLDPPPRLQLWAGSFRRFFPWIWLVVIALPLSGYWIIQNVYQGMAMSPLHVHLMNGIGTVMILIFVYIFFMPYRRLKRAVVQENWQAGGGALAQIRRMVGINLILGLVTIAVAAAGRYPLW